MEFLNYICNSINNSKLEEEPFSHLYIKNFFDNNFYKNLLQSLPKKEEYKQLNKTASVSDNYPEERYIFDITPTSLNQLEDSKKLVFQKIVNGFLSTDFFNIIIKKFKTTIDERIKNFSPEEIELFGKDNFKFDARIALVKDYTKYQLGAHTDNINKLLTFLFYLPEDDSLKSIGTSLYKRISNNISSTNEHFSIQDTSKHFKEIKRAEFIPNSVLIFARSNITYHGVSSVNTGSLERNLLLLNFYFKQLNK